MHNLKEIRNNVDRFKESLKKRFLDVDVEKILKLDEQNRKYIQEKEVLEKEKKDISKSKDKTLFKRSKKISDEIEKIGKQQSDLKNKLDKILSSIPNIAHSDVPIGNDEKSNVEVLPTSGNKS